MSYLKLKRHGFVLRCCMAAALMALASCGGGGGAAAVATGNVGGSAGDGPLVGTTVTITDANGAVVGTAKTDANAHYNIAVPLTAAVPLTITFGTDGIDQVTGQAPTIPLSTVALTVPAGGVTANANPLSTLAVETAKKLGGLTAANIAAAVSSVRTSLGFGVPSTFDPIGGVINANNVASTIKANEAAAELIRRATAATGKTQANAIAALAEDLTDGVVDGKVKAGVTATQASANVAAQIQAQIAAVGIEVINNNLVVTTNGTTAAPLKGGAANITAALDNAATLSNGGVAPTVTVANVPLETIFIQQTKVAVDAANTLAGGGNTALNAISAALGTVLASNNATNVGVLTTATSTNAGAAVTAISTATTNAAAGTNVATANNGVTSALSFKLNANSVTLTDYNAANVAQTPQTLAGTVAAGTMTLAAPTTNIIAANLQNLAAATPTGTSPKLAFGLANLPVASGTATVTALLKDGTTATRSAAQRQITLVFNVNWTSDGTTLTLTAAAGTATATFFTTADTSTTGVTVTLTNASANILSVGTSVTVPNAQAQLNAAIANIFSTTTALGTALTAVQAVGNYYYQIDFTGFPFLGANSTSFTQVKGTFTAQ